MDKTFSKSRKPSLRITIKDIFLSSTSSPKSCKSNVSLIMNTCGLIEKENLYLTTKKEFKHVTKLNTQYSEYLELMRKLTRKWNANRRKAKEMMLGLQNKFKEYSVIVDSFDKKLKLFNYEKENIVNSNEEIIHQRMQLQGKINQQLKDITKQTDRQKEKIETLIKKQKQLKMQKDKECKRLEQNEKNDRYRIEKLRREYEILKLKVEKYYEETKGSEMYRKDILEDEQFSRKMITRENQEIQLREQKMQNDILNERYMEINGKVNELKMKNFKRNHTTRYMFSTSRKNIKSK